MANLRSMTSEENYIMSERHGKQVPPLRETRIRDWLAVTPVANLAIDRTAIPSGEIEIAGVTLMDVERFQRVAKRRWHAVGAGMRTTLCGEFLRYYNEPKAGRPQVQTLAVQQANRKGSVLESDFHSDVRRAIAILAATQWTYSPRDPLFSFGTLEQASQAQRIWFFQDVNKPFGDRALFGFARRERIAPRWIDGFWLSAERQHRFLKHTNLFFATESPVTKNWNDSLDRAFRLFGEGYLEYDAQQAAFANLIALDVLLFEREENGNSKSKLLHALLRWIRMYTPPGHLWAGKDKIKRLIDIRNDLAHVGYSLNLTANDLLLSDDIVGNLLFLIVRNRDIFTSKNAVREFAKQEQAREKLGMDTPAQFVRRNEPTGHILRAANRDETAKRLVGLHAQE